MGILYHSHFVVYAVNMNSTKRKAASFKTEFPGDNSIKADIQEKFAQVKEKMHLETQESSEQ